jgi:hypothetical protein
MQLNSTIERIITAAFFIAIILSNQAFADDRIVELEFTQPSAGESDIDRTMQSITKVQGTNGLCQDAAYLITQYGDREELFAKANQEAIDNPMINQTWRFCSAFATSGGDNPILGRNWDNQNVNAIIISKYYPADGYKSISISRASDLGYPFNLDLEQIKSSDLAHKLLLAPYYSMDGINEHGLTVAVTGLRQSTHELTEGKEPVFITFLIRKLLDQTETVAEAATFVDSYIPFDLDVNSLNGHLIVADSTGKSVILEYEQNQWRKIYPDQPWQVLSTKPIYDIPEADRVQQCWRYQGMTEALIGKQGKLDWHDGMTILRDVHQDGTTWSTVYMLAKKELYLTVYQSWGTVYHLRMQ